MLKTLKSRTNWTVVIMVATAFVQSTQAMLPEREFTLIMAILGALTMYFKMNPSQDYK